MEKSALLEFTSRCTSLRVFKQIQTQLISRHLLRDDSVVDKVVTFFGKSADFASYSCVFLHTILPSLSSYPYNTLLSSYAVCDKPRATILVYRTFLRNGLPPDTYTFPPLFKACGKFSGIGEGKQIHGSVTKMGFLSDVYVQNSLLHFYGSCGNLESACKVFDEMLVRDVVSWTGVISGFSRIGLYKEALRMFLKMDVEANLATYICALVASGRVGWLRLGQGIHGLIMKKAYLFSLEIGAVEYGRWVHEYVVRAGIKWDTHIGTAVVDMYAKCGCIETALEVFNGIRIKNVYTWNALLGGLAIHGHGHESLRYFEKMVKLGFKPNEVTFLAVLNACCHTGLVDEGRRYFYKMITGEYNLSPKLEHYGCLIDMLCRAGLLDEALELVKAMPVKPDVLICGAILSACKSRETLTELPKEILDKFLEMEFEDSGVYVLLSNIFAANRRWNDVAKIRRLMKVKGISKVPGSSAIDVN
ncbi:PREDICTED: pentatricopeptide repeat-containing protein At4g38010 isoform X3 [Brassica oleracea var. oleracea]|uniref:pentatricopeptide repeat-containing protein At4g38010 isoform X3 n=1 Tax=Brassica oleracea var. oleracea TaxID=109376 RepID=UPI0006A6EBAC|nr:PREDICTED: pentatricopeptide repeat-containing protein At4g38010 isoform X3 [Brassica oleracea var. oleracea]